MKSALRIVLLIINRISFVLVFLCGISGIVEQLLGPGNYEKMLKKLKIPLSYEQWWLFMLVCLIVLIITYILIKKFFQNARDN